MPVLLKKQDTFATDERGTVAVLFGLMFTVLTFSAGMAIDYGRVVHTQTKFSAAVDAATLAAGRALLSGGTEAEAEAIAIKFLEENVDASALHATYKTPDVDVDVATGGVTVSVSPVVQMTLTSILGFDTITVPVTASTKFDSKDIELGMALDITGSMAGSKIADLKTAAKDLVEILLPDGGTQNKVRIGLAPYSAAVNLHKYASAVSGGASTDGCVWERTGANAFTDAAPSSGHYFHAGGVPKDIDATEGTSSYLCPKAKLEPLTDDKGVLKAAINSYKADGFTAGHIGATWAWNLISPDWDSIWPIASKPVSYGDGKTLKAIILMTDGIFNTAYYNGTSSGQAVNLCDAMKVQGVVVYAIGFKAPAGAETTLKTCATSEDHYFNANNGSELQEAFVAIAQQLNNLRLTN